MEVLDALSARSGVVCVVGAGGKKTTLYTLADEARSEGLDPVVTATVRIPIFDSQVARVCVAERPVTALSENDSWPLGLVPERDREDRYAGYPREVVDRIWAAGESDVVLVKGDGARTRELKAPGENEPQIPNSADVVLPIASVQAVGEPLTEEIVHRPERISEITGLQLGERIGSGDVAAVLASPAGGLKAVPDGATVVPLLNKVDDEEWATIGREIADRIHNRADLPRVVLASMIAEQPLVDVIE